MISLWHLVWIVPISIIIGIILCALLSANACAEERNNLQKLQAAFMRLGTFGRLFVDYKGCPRAAFGRAEGVPIEEEVLHMPPIRDINGGEWIPVNADALRELVSRYKEAPHHA